MSVANGNKRMMNSTHLQALVDDYHARYDHIAQNAAFFQQLPTFEAAADYAGFAKRPDGKRQRHQYRIKYESLKTMHETLVQQKTVILALTSFDQLITLIRNSRSAGVGELTIYDTALRLGAWLNLAPEKVYLHAGTRTGAKKLGLSVDREALELDELPPPLQSLTPAQLEDFLCIYKDHFKPYDPRDDDKPIETPHKRSCHPADQDNMPIKKPC